jgi:hypothetical protein
MRSHPLVCSAGIAVALTVGVGTVGVMTGVGPFAPYAKQYRLRRKFGTRGVVEDGMLKEAVGKSLFALIYNLHFSHPCPIAYPAPARSACRVAPEGWLRCAYRRAPGQGG